MNVGSITGMAVFLEEGKIPHQAVRYVVVSILRAFLAREPPKPLKYIQVGGVGGQENQFELVLDGVEEGLKTFRLVRGGVVEDDPDFPTAPEHSQHVQQVLLEVLRLQSLDELHVHAPRLGFHDSRQVHALAADWRGEDRLVPLLGPHTVNRHYPLDAGLVQV